MMNEIEKSKIDIKKYCLKVIVLLRIKIYLMMSIYYKKSLNRFLY